MSFRETGEYLRQLAMLSRKEFLQFFRDPVLVLFLIYAFTLSIIAASTVVSTQLRNATTVTMDHDRTRTSRELLHGFREPYFRMKGPVHADRQAIRQLDGGDAMVVLDIPEGFQDALRQQRTVDVQMLVDASNSHVAFMSSSYAERIVQRFLDEQDAQRRRPHVPHVELRQRFWFNPNLRDKPFRALEQIARMSLLFSMLLPASAMARERERGTIQQLLVSPLTPVQIMLSKVLPMTCIVLAATTFALLVVVRGLLGVALHGNVVAYLALSAVFAINASGIGLPTAIQGFASHQSDQGRIHTTRALTSAEIHDLARWTTIAHRKTMAETEADQDFQQTSGRRLIPDAWLDDDELLMPLR